MVTNLVLLPSLIMTFDKRSYTKGGHALIDEFDPGSLPKAEDDLVDLDKMKIHDKEGATKQGP